ncbi:putative reverse transcriptase domain-containing protein [Tanacetum coccineum]
MNDLEEEYQARALLAKSKRFFKKGTQRFSSAKATDQTECHKCDKKGHFARDCWSKTSVPSYQLPFQPKLIHSSEHKPEPRFTKDFEAKYNKVKAKLAFLNSSALAPSSSSALMALADEERVFVGKESARNGEWIKISMKKILVLKQAKLDLLTMHHVNTKILKENHNLRNELKELTSITEALLNNTSSSGQKDLVFIKSSADNSEVSITGGNKPKLSEAEDSTLTNHDTGKVPLNESQRNTTDYSIVVSNSLVTNYDSADESSVCSTPLPPLEKLTGVKPVFGPKTIKLILKSKSTFKAETLKGIIINEPSLALLEVTKVLQLLKTNSAPADIKSHEALIPIVDPDADAEVTLVDETQEMNDDSLMFDTEVLEEQEKEVAKKEVSTADSVTTAGEVVSTANVEATNTNCGVC